ncbi:MAG: hypothetical protein KatS3mg103_0648 [Phycisphaerales bacterium]|nr:MAG: hypothetical protein KatS3mg103_0648 [Phycisphaerales bacterium]
MRPSGPASSSGCCGRCAFLRQLTADASLDHLLEADELAFGGVRAAVWDQRQPSVATSPHAAGRVRSARRGQPASSLDARR